MGHLTLLFAAGCAHELSLPSAASVGATSPVWPEPPEAARVAYAGAIALPALQRPLDVGCDGRSLVVVDPDPGDVWVVDIASSKFRRAPRGPNAPRTPVSASLSPSGEVLVADASEARVLSLRDVGARWQVIETEAALSRPTAALALPEGRLVVVDTAAHRVLSIDPETGAARPIGPERGELGEGFNFPVDAAPAPDGTLLVADALNAAVQRLDLEGSPPSFVAGGPGEGGGALIRPKGLALDRWGRLHVVDAGMQHIQVYDPASGALLGRYGRPGSGDGELLLPSGICISGDLVYVADTLNRRVQVFALLGGGP